MRSVMDRRLAQPTIGVVTMMAALSIIASSWIGTSISWSPGPASAVAMLVPVCFIVAITLAYRFPIYIRHKTKVCLFTAPLYLIAVFLEPLAAATAAGLGIFLGEMAVRKRHSSGPGEIATQTGRWLVVVLVGSRVAHAASSTTSVGLHTALLLLTAGVLFAGDLLTVPLALIPMSHERLDRIIFACLRGAGLVETAQYAIGVVGVLAVEHEAWVLVLLIMPVVLLYLLYKKEVDRDTYLLMENMADVVDLRDPYAVDHSRRVAELVQGILQEMGRNGQEAALIWRAARVHDIGNVDVPDHILLKAEPLTTEERTEVEAHAARGAALLAEYSDFGPVVEMVRHHHERWDGHGYPDGLQGYDIPFGARVIAVAEDFDAMTSDRPYRMALSRAQAAQILRAGRGRHWDPSVVDALIRRIDRSEGVAVRRADMGLDLRLESPEAARSAARA